VPPPTYWISLGRPPPAPSWLLHFGTAHLPRPPPAPNWIHRIHHRLLVIPSILSPRGKRIGEAVGVILSVCIWFEARCIDSRLLLDGDNWRNFWAYLVSLLNNFIVEILLDYFLWEQYVLLWNFWGYFTSFATIGAICLVIIHLGHTTNLSNIPGFSCFRSNSSLECRFLRSLKRGGLQVYTTGISREYLCVPIYSIIHLSYSFLTMTI
jgi:hypothetical protein